MATPQRPRPRPQLARINAMKKSPYSAEVGLDDHAACGGELDVGGEFASQTSFRIRGGAEVAALFRKLGLSGPEDFTIPPAVYASRRRPSLEASSGAGAGAGAGDEGSSSSPPEIPEISGRDVMVATRTETAGDGEQARLAIKLVQSEVVEAFARTYEGSGAESSSRLVESEKVEASRREVAAAPKQDNADEDKEDDKLTKVDKLREERREVVVEATRENAGALVLVVSESTSRDIEHLVSPSPNRRFRRTITSWLKGEHLGSGSFGSVYEAISDDGFFFAVKEVSLVDQGINAKQRILQLEHEISLLSRLEHENIVRYFGTDKTQHMVDQLTELQRREQMFSEANKCLRRKLEESNQVHGQQLWEHDNHNLLRYERQSKVQLPLHGGNEFSHPFSAAGEPTLQIGYPPETLNGSCMTSYMTPWLL